MNLSLGIVGLPNVGKSTLFNALTKKSVLVANYPFATIDPSVGVVAVPDERLYKLAEFSKTQKTVPAIVEFVDIAGLVKGASAGEGLGNQFLTNDGKINPLKDIEVINLELILADMQTVSKRLTNLNREVKANKKEAIIEYAILTKVQKALEAGKLAGTVVADEFEAPFLKGMHLLTNKKFMYVLNKKNLFAVQLYFYFK